MRKQLGALVLATGAFLCAIAPASGQEVRGRLLAEADGEPLAGAYVALVRDSSAVATALTRADGWFQLRAPEPGRYTVRADHLGYRRVQMLVSVTGAEPVWVDLSTGQEAVELEGLVAEVDRECDIDDEAAARVARLWDEVSKAFQVATVAEDQGLYRLSVDQWRRALDPDELRVEEELERREGRGNQRSSPFESLPPEELEEGGYIQGDDRRGYAYYAPDARVLLSRSFQDSHCFGMEDDEPDDLPEGVTEDDWTGIRFEPRDPDDPDVRGVLWIDGDNLEPRRMDFRYTHLPWPVDHDELGGRVGFRRLPEGPWVVSDWRIRMPVIDAEEYRPYASAPLRLRYQVVRLTEVGGRVTEVGRRGGETVTFGETGAVEGRVLEADGEPASEAMVALAGTFFSTVADADGSFALDGVPEGRYRVVSTSPRIDALGLKGGGEAEVQVRPRGTSTVELTLPDPAALLAEQCPTPLRQGAAGILRGAVAPGEAGSVEDVLVELSWSESVDLDMAPGTVGVEVATAKATVPVDDDGRWMACGVPVDETVRVAAVRPERGGRPASETREVRLSEGEIPELVLPLSETEGFEAPVELEGLTVEVAARVREDLMDIGTRREALGSRFISTEDIQENIHGAMNATHLVERQRIPGVMVRNWQDFQCVALRRAAAPTAGPGGTRAQLCASLVVDGVPSHPSVLQLMRPENIAAMALLTPSEAGARFGGLRNQAAGGILYIWTHGGVEGARDPH